MRHSRRLLATGGAAPPERHSLTLDGVADRLYVQDVRPGAGTTYASVIKLAGPQPSVNFGYLQILSVPSRTTGFRNISDAIGSLNTNNRHYVTGTNSAGSVNYFSSGAPADGAASAHVQCLGRDLTANTAAFRAFLEDGTTVWAPTAVAAAEDAQPLDIIIGCYTNYLFGSPAGFVPMAWVASVILDIIPTDDELRAYAAGKDARKVWPANTIYYVTATGLVGAGSGPIVPVVGTSNTICVGPTAADLVAL